MPAAAAIIPSIIGMGTSLLGGAMGAGASKQAAQIQSAAATKQAEDFKALLAQYNPQIGAAGTAAAGAVNDATAAGQTAIGGAVTGGQQGIGNAVTAGQALLQPYIGAGGQSLATLMSAMGPGGDLNKQFTTQDMQAYDPGYSFRIAQANKALAGSAAARGGALGGGTLAAMAGLNQNLASSEFGNAEARFRAQQTDRFNRLNSLVNMGAGAATTAGGYGMTGANEAANLGLTGATSAADLGYRGAMGAGGFTTGAAQQQAANALATQGNIANLMTGGANAQAAGTMGSANAWSGALGGVGNAAGQVGNYFQQQNLMNWLKQNPGVFANPAVKLTP
jgi:hypothetical protein